MWKHSHTSNIKHVKPLNFDRLIRAEYNAKTFLFLKSIQQSDKAQNGSFFDGLA